MGVENTRHIIKNGLVTRLPPFPSIQFYTTPHPLNQAIRITNPSHRYHDQL